jgi:hypothetical protein
VTVNKLREKEPQRWIVEISPGLHSLMKAKVGERRPPLPLARDKKMENRACAKTRPKTEMLL